MGVEHHALDARQQVGAIVRELAARLQEAGVGISQQHRHDVAQPVRRRPEIDIEHRDQRLARGKEALGQSSGLEACAVGAMPMLYLHALALECGGGVRDHLHAFVRRVVEDLKTQPVARPVQRGDGPHRADSHLVLVEDRDLHQHRGQVGLSHEGPRQVVAPVWRPQHVVEPYGDQGEETGADQNQAGGRDVEADLAGGEQHPGDDQSRAYFEEERALTRSLTAMALPRHAYAFLALPRSIASAMSALAFSASPQPVIFTHLVFSRSL